MADTAEHPAPVTIIVEGATTTFRFADGVSIDTPIGPAAIVATDLAGAGDPPAPAALTNALGTVADHVDDVVLARPDLLRSELAIHGAEIWHLVTVEAGTPIEDPVVELTRSAAEEVFRTLATEPVAARLHNPGLDPARVVTVLGACCLVLGIVRRLQRDRMHVVRDCPPEP